MSSHTHTHAQTHTRGYPVIIYICLISLEDLTGWSKKRQLRRSVIVEREPECVERLDASSELRERIYATMMMMMMINAADNVVAIIENDRRDVYVYVYRCRARRCLPFPRRVRFLFARGEFIIIEQLNREPWIIDESNTDTTRERETGGKLRERKWEIEKINPPITGWRAPARGWLGIPLFDYISSRCVSRANESASASRTAATRRLSPFYPAMHSTPPFAEGKGKGMADGCCTWSCNAPQPCTARQGNRRKAGGRAGVARPAPPWGWDRAREGEGGGVREAERGPASRNAARADVLGARALPVRVHPEFALATWKRRHRPISFTSETRIAFTLDPSPRVSISIISYRYSVNLLAPFYVKRDFCLGDMWLTFIIGEGKIIQYYSRLIRSIGLMRNFFPKTVE